MSRPLNETEQYVLNQLKKEGLDETKTTNLILQSPFSGGSWAAYVAKIRKGVK